MHECFSSSTSPHEYFAKEAEEMLKPFELSPLLTFITRANGEIVHANRKFFLVTGMLRQPEHRHYWFNLAVNAGKSEHDDLIRKLKDEGVAENIEMTFHFPDLTPAHRFGLLTARMIKCGNEPCILFTINDISKIHHLSGELCHIEGLKVASELAAGVGHEIRNPMTSVRGFLQMLSQKPDFEKYQSYFQLMIEELDRASAIITEFLSLTKTKARQFATENLNSIIMQIFPLLSSNATIANKSITLDLQTIPSFLADSGDIRKLLINMVKNGLESMEEGGNLTIHTVQNDPDTVTLAIQDEGGGIPDDIMAKIGTPFFTTKENGTGIGLSLCYEIADRHHAKIEIKTSANGTTFFIHFALTPTP